MNLIVHPYLNFDGNTREAMTFYQSVFGGDLAIHTYGEAGVTDMPADAVMNAELRSPHLLIMACDAKPGAAATWGGTRNYISLNGDDLDTLTEWFNRLAEGGSIGMPLAMESWGMVFGLCMDRFGIEWMFNISPTEASTQSSATAPATGSTPSDEAPAVSE